MPASKRPHITSETPLPISMQYPGEWWDSDFSAEKQRDKDKIIDGIQDASVIGIVDSDADGLGCEVVIREAYPDESVFCFSAGHRESVNVPEAGELLLEHAPNATEIIIADLCPDPQTVEDFIAPFAEHDAAVVVCDHHEWSSEMRETVSAVSNLVLESDKCATQIVLETLIQDPTDQLQEFAAVTADHDLWIKEDSRSDDLSDYSFWMDDRSEYVQVCREYGADILNDESVAKSLAQNRAEKDAKIRIAVDGPSDEERAESEAWIRKEVVDAMRRAKLREDVSDLLSTHSPSDGALNTILDGAYDIFATLHGQEVATSVKQEIDLADYAEENFSLSETDLETLISEYSYPYESFGLNKHEYETLRPLTYNTGADWFELSFDEFEFALSYEWALEHSDEIEPEYITYTAETVDFTDLQDESIESLLSDVDGTSAPISLLRDVYGATGEETREIALNNLRAYCDSEDVDLLEPETEHGMTVPEELASALPEADLQAVYSISGPLTVAVLYGSVYASGASEYARTAGADIVIHIPPWNKASIRASSDVPVANTIASELTGGGHPEAAGCKPNAVGKGGKSYPEHWATQGAATKTTVMHTIVELFSTSEEPASISAIDSPE